MPYVTLHPVGSCGDENAVTFFAARDSECLRKLCNRKEVLYLISSLEFFCERNTDLFANKQEMLNEYMNEMKTLDLILTSAYGKMRHSAVIPPSLTGSHLDSCYLLKLRYKEPLRSITLDKMMDASKRVFPLSELFKADGGRNAVYDAMASCFIDDSIPNKSPIARTLSDIFYFSFDYEISNVLANEGVQRDISGNCILMPERDGLVYTRWDNNLWVSGRDPFDGDEVLTIVRSILDGRKNECGVEIVSAVSPITTSF